MVAMTNGQRCKWNFLGFHLFLDLHWREKLIMTLSTSVASEYI